MHADSAYMRIGRRGVRLGIAVNTRADHDRYVRVRTDRNAKTIDAGFLITSSGGIGYSGSALVLALRNLFRRKS
ncbi:MAG: hypothetical protein B7Y41_00350 [Hydrogenophilales bacterium 28-61-23]|nr:MAG: hypothetical protein B7Y41_00350 [Hydrogenophilales bacterium 28-61-23]